MYTHVNMPNGEYLIRVTTAPYEFEGLLIPTSGTLDSIRVTVRGSVYDDRR